MVLKRPQGYIDNNPDEPAEAVSNTAEPTRSFPKRAYLPQVVEVVNDDEQQPSSFVEKNEVTSFGAQNMQTADDLQVIPAMKLPIDARAIDETKVVSPKLDEPKKIEPIPNPIPQSQPIESNVKNDTEVVNEFFQQDSVGYPEISEHKKNSFMGFVVWGIVVIAIASAIGAVLLFFSQGSVTFSTIPITPVVLTQSPPVIGQTLSPQAVSPTPSPVTVKLDKSDISIQVLNGGGIKGAAGDMKSALEKAGYSVKNVGNASEYIYTLTEIYVKSDKKQFLQLLEDDLKGEYTIGKKEATLSSDVSYDARIIVGKE